MSGLIAGIRLSRAGFQCLLIEKKIFPFHRVCGEYISNETLPFLKKENLFPEKVNPPHINQFQLSSVSGKSIQLPLDLGGFGISRYAFDYFLYEQAIQSEVKVIMNKEVEKIDFQNDRFTVSANNENFEADYVIGAFGKRSRLDVTGKRSFTLKRSPFVGIKYHIRIDHPENVIALHNFPGGYCGISNVEDGKTNLCYLTQRDNLKKYGSIPEMEEEVLWQNPHLKNIFNRAHHLFESPETINEISFETKEPVWRHVLMMGDAAGMIAPLCGNGMAMAIHSAKILTDIFINAAQQKSFTRENIELAYTHAWNKNFSSRLWFGRLIQNKLFGREWSSNMAIKLAVYAPFIARQIIKNTHGEPF